jgi:hypothetical protein
MGVNEHAQGEAPIRPGAPVVRVRTFSPMGGTEVKVRRGAGDERRMLRRSD